MAAQANFWSKWLSLKRGAAFVRPKKFRPTSKKAPTLVWFRRVSQAGFLFLFLYFLVQTRFIEGEPTKLPISISSIFLETDPLVAFATTLGSHTLYSRLVWALPLIIATMMLGRFFCGWICPFGTLHHLASWVRPSRVGMTRIERNKNHKYQRIKFWIVIAMLVGCLFTTVQIGLLDPICLMVRSVGLAIIPAIEYSANGLMAAAGMGAGEQFYFHYAWLLGFLFIGLLFLNRVIVRFWCRAICPLGAFLGFLARFSIFGMQKKHEKCTDCNLCLVHCQAADNPQGGVKWMGAECHLCMNCEAACPEDVINFKFFPEKEASVEPAVDLGRRQVITAAAAGAALLPIARASDALAVNYDHRAIRPPGSVEEHEFLSKCIKCGECMKVCPRNALHPAMFEFGIEGLWSPILIPRIGYCEFNCTMCGQACPTGAIARIPQAQKEGTGAYEGRPVKIGTAMYALGRCLPWAMDVPCIVCEEWCPTSPKAIWVEEVDRIGRNGEKIHLQLPKVDPALCIGCGACEYACPVQDKKAVYVTVVGETRDPKRKLLLQDTPNKATAPRPPDAKSPSEAKKKDEPAAPTSTATSTPTSTAPLKDLKAALPEIAGWKTSGKPRSYGKKNLYELINGAAESYIELGFVEVVTVEYKQTAAKSDNIVSVYMYDMGSPLGAFGKYSQERQPDFKFEKVGVEAFFGGMNIVFWQGRYLVKIDGYEESAAGNAVLLSFARAIEMKLPGPKQAPPSLEKLPVTGRVLRSEKYFGKNFLGQKFLTNGYTADYKLGDKSFTLFLVEEESQALAARNYGAFKLQLAKGGKAAVDLQGIGEAAFRAEDPYLKKLLVVRRGKALLGAFGEHADVAGQNVAGLLNAIK